MEILILSKTHMGHSKCCVGGMTMDGDYVRLLTGNGDNQPEHNEFIPRQIWDIEFTKRRALKPPHIEDVLILSQKFKKNLSAKTKMIDFITERNAPIWEGHPDLLFDETIRWTDKGSGFVNEDAVPANSVGFWVPDKKLTKRISYDKTRYDYKTSEGRNSLPYVGYEPAIEFIPNGTLVRVSLTRWWNQEGNTELRCALQLSGWYDYDE